MKTLKEDNHTKERPEALFVFIAFLVFLFAFVSLGSGDSYREERLTSSVLSWKKNPRHYMTSEEFIELYMPYFEYFARK